MTKLLKRMKGYGFELTMVTICIAGSAFSDLLLPNYLADIINEGIPSEDINYILSIGGVMMIITLIGIVSAILRGYFANRISVGFSKELRSGMFKNIQTFSMKEMDKFGTASLITRTTNDVNQVQNMLIIVFRMVLLAPFKIIGSIYMAFVISPKFATVMLCSIPAILIVVGVIAKFALPLSEQMQKKTDTINMILREKLTGVRVIRAFNTLEHEEKRFEAGSKDLASTSIKMMQTIGLMFPALSLTANLTTVALVWTGAVEASVGNVMVGDILAVIQYIMQIMMSLIMISMVFAMMPRATVSAKRILEVLDTKTSIESGEGVSETQNNSISFEDVTFYYPGAKEPVLKGVNFVANQGETTAIIGSTGCGKTTLINLMLRFYDVTEGSVKIGGVDTREFLLEDLRDRIGYVPQKALLFKGNIKTNLQMSDPNADINQMMNALGIAQASGFISQKEEGIESEVERGGVNFSGGQKQRLSIARALTRKAPIYIFDDSFSALDYATDSKLRKSLTENVTDSAIIVVAQRVSSIKDADKIVVLDGGEIVGIGKHDELVENCIVYNEIVNSQLSAQEVAK